MKTLFYTEKCTSYPIGDRQFGLGLVDKKKLTCESRLSKNENLANKYNFFRTCLEEIGKLFSQEEDKSLVFKYSSSGLENVARFIGIFENELKKNTSLKVKSVFFNTTGNNIGAVRVSPFWLNCPMKRRLFLILLRAGQSFTTEHTFKTFLEQEINYLEKITPMLECFLLGYTKFSHSCLDRIAFNMHHGIIYQFQDWSAENILTTSLKKE